MNQLLVFHMNEIQNLFQSLLAQYENDEIVPRSSLSEDDEDELVSVVDVVPEEYLTSCPYATAKVTWRARHSFHFHCEC